MTDSVLAMLRRLLVDDYRGLKERLARRFGSADFAGEVLHEAWLRLDRIEASVSTAAVHNPEAYLYRVALNVATDQRRTDKSWLGKVEIEAIYRRAQDDLDPERIMEARSELQALAQAVEQLPPRRRAIFIAARLEQLPHKTIAERQGITVRVVDRELKAALDHFSKILDKKSIPRRGPRSHDPSEV
jgi:RNA polymerase sigma-70 factor (ECF subfamily)